MTNHDHDYYHDDCSLCQMEKESDTSKETARAVFQDLLVDYREALDDLSISSRMTDKEIDAIVSFIQLRWDSIK